MSSVAARFPRPAASTWESIFGVVYLVVMTNLMLAVASLPLLVMLVTTDPRSSWPALALTGVAAAPGLAGAFAVFRGYTVERSTDVVRTFWTAWRRHLRRSLALGFLAMGTTAVLAVDLSLAWGSRVGAVVTPVLMVLLVLVVVTALHALVASVERPEARLRDVLRASLYLGVRRWYLSLASLAVVALLAYLFTLHPALAVGLAAAPLWYTAWGNCRFALRPVLPAGSSVTV